MPMIEEFGARPIKAGESFSAAFLVGYFDNLEEANQVGDEHRGYSGLEVIAGGWKLTGSTAARPRKEHGNRRNRHLTNARR